jgi:ribosome-associated toxin RatA of RatAB toxin-antitoxin module
VAAEPVHRTHIVPNATPPEVYAVVADFPAYPRLFPEFSVVRELERDGKRVRVEFNVNVVIAARYVLDLVCDPAAHSIDWTFVEGNIITDSQGSWRFTPDGQGTRIDYRAALEVKTRFLPGFVLRKIGEAVTAGSLPAMFAAITREVAQRKRANP